MMDMPTFRGLGRRKHQQRSIHWQRPSSEQELRREPNQRGVSKADGTSV